MVGETTHRKTTARKVTVASLVGTTIEWYEFFIYGTAAALVFPALFFPSEDPLVGILVSLSTFAVAFLARPIGGVVFGHLGDRVGRKATLVLTLMLMGGATFAIGLLPTYHSVGVAAPVLLVALRVIQGLSLGGEYGGSVLMAVEHSRGRRRGFFGSVVNMGAPAGLLLANGVYLGLSVLSEDAFLSWGWRVPFLLSVILLVVGTVIRLRLSESPEFAGADSASAPRTPFMTVIASHLGPALLMMLAYASAGVTFYIGTVFSLSFGTTTLGIERDLLLLLVVVGNLVAIVGLPFFGWLSDHTNRRAIFIAGILGMGVLAWPWFGALASGSIGWMVLGFSALFIPYAATYGTMAAFFAHVFPPAVRFTGMSLGYTLGTVVSSAIAPLVATGLLGMTGSWTAIAIYMSATAAISAVAAFFLSERFAPSDMLRSGSTGRAGARQDAH
ncbi:Predicted arabinose efflux permease, MFS family [Pseudonocardia ammonioxydans]|uniref:Putative proline/betaine transporter n=1 Tax=Pseudonocardia ammonioxydans TaxID=260086 RepID=A0A1I4S7B6_PSUAM|nr:MFS transporter [Pseudonocardia ammonioxydans]SFM60392.1 Predicted arabinose efflux permease, MFS family [Pseudonocardia ammonioxydans]